MQTFNLYQGNCLDQLKNLQDDSVDSIVTDPPYGLSFMGKKWDYDVPSVEIWEECLRVLKPGGHLLAFAGTRTQHRMAVRIEDAGFEIRDMIAWAYGSGFPKSLDVSKAIDKVFCSSIKKGDSGTIFNGKSTNGGSVFRSDHPEYVKPKAITETAKQWAGWGTALKPALEPITVARKPLIGTVAENVLKHGTGGINIDGCRVPLNGDYKSKANGRPSQTGLGDNYDPEKANQPDTVGRFPANFIHDGSDEVLDLFPYSRSTGGKTKSDFGDKYGNFSGKTLGSNAGGLGDEGSAARFFYCAKASKKDRDDGLDGFELKQAGGMKDRNDGSMGSITLSKNTHPTVKPVDLMSYLCRLVTPPNGTVLDPFMGSGSTGKGAIAEGFNFIGIELDPEYHAIANARIQNELDKKIKEQELANKPTLF